MDIAYKKIFENNKKWVNEQLNKDKDFFENLSKDQTPDYLYIGCSDSRVPANEIMGLEPGDVFVHRNIANIVNGIDHNVNAVIQYAVEYLKVKHIIVCGHYGCGGIKAAMTSQDMGELNAWLRNIRDVYRLHQEELDNIIDEHEKYNRLVELNVFEQCINVIKTAHVQKAWYQDGFPEVHGWVFDLSNGLLIDLKLNMKEQIKKIRKIYDLKK
jgi:carbonic anhydrase